MKTAGIYSVTSRKAPGYVWKWRSDDGKTESSAFTYFYDCVEDARKEGYDVDMALRQQATGTLKRGYGKTGS